MFVSEDTHCTDKLCSSVHIPAQSNACSTAQSEGSDITEKIQGVSFIGGGNRRIRRKPLTCRMSLKESCIQEIKIITRDSVIFRKQTHYSTRYL